MCTNMPRSLVPRPAAVQTPALLGAGSLGLVYRGRDRSKRWSPRSMGCSVGSYRGDGPSMGARRWLAAARPSRNCDSHPRCSSAARLMSRNAPAFPSTPSIGSHKPEASTKSQPSSPARPNRTSMARSALREQARFAPGLPPDTACPNCHVPSGSTLRTLTMAAAHSELCRWRETRGPPAGRPCRSAETNLGGVGRRAGRTPAPWRRASRRPHPGKRSWPGRHNAHGLLPIQNRPARLVVSRQSKGFLLSPPATERPTDRRGRSLPAATFQMP